MDKTLEIVHMIEKKLNKRLTDAEYTQVALLIEDELRKISIKKGLEELNKWTNRLPKSIKDSILKK